MAYLRRFKKDELIFNQEEAERILQFFFGSIRVHKTQITQDDIAFAQALLAEGIEASNKMSVAEALFKVFLYKVPSSFLSIATMVARFVKMAPAVWWQNKKISSLKDVKIYDMVRNAISIRFVSEWNVRQQTEEPIGYLN